VRCFYTVEMNLMDKERAHPRQVRTADLVREKIYPSVPFRELIARVQAAKPRSRLPISGLAGSLHAFAAAGIFEQCSKQVLLVVADAERAAQLYDDCALVVPESNVTFLGDEVERNTKLLDMSSPVARVETLIRLLNRTPLIIVSSVRSLATPVPPPGELSGRRMEIQRGKSYPFEGLTEKLLAAGFERTDFVGEYGEFAVRGGIVDVFPFVGENPVRFEFWGDTVESIREFDPASQRSIRSLQSANLVGSLPPKEAGPQPASLLFEYLRDDAVIFLDEPALLARETEHLATGGDGSVVPWLEIERRSSDFLRVEHSTLTADKNPPAVQFGTKPHPAINGSMKVFVRYLDAEHSDGREVFVGVDGDEEDRRLRELVGEEKGMEPRSVPDQGSQGEDEAPTAAEEIRTPSYSPLFDSPHSGFSYAAAGITLCTEHEIFGRLKRRGKGRTRRFAGITQKELAQLRRGDFVVHVDYGIGKFAGLQRIKLRNVEQEVMKILYQNEDSIYVNLNFVNRVQKYMSREGHVPALTRLGSPDWERLQSRARKRIKDIARDLIKLYARRKHELGFAFSPDTHWQKELEASFMYEDTPDQAGATADVKKDMEAASPMDRLICGDVGFGKTEVAVRAAFKAVMSGRQAAILVPTTILAYQHYHTFLDRVGRYSTRVESLSRFTSPASVKKILQDVQAGSVDILIGTHRILSKDVVFKNLGLLVIDEEHRFGVASKEKLRQLRATVDTLTLTATPIPRTLQFSLMGARDLSIMNTPPRNRLPIFTEIMERDPRLIREAILKELHRGGQVYFIHDRIHDMDQLLADLHKQVPEAKFQTAHGQMKGHELERTMMEFLEKKFDVLVCTKIIESGIDIPSVNTIIINRADRFGLAELYQLRGRVGRSNIQAYAYLLTPPISILPKQTLRRLQAIREFTELGSGLNLAMRDLEIRGAGNLLGGEQSGFIMEMGFEMYQRVVQEAVEELKNEEFAETFETAGAVAGRAREEITIETDIESLIPAMYVEDDGERLEIYRRLYKESSLAGVEAMRNELKDRFGEYPEEVEHLLLSVEARILGTAAGVTKIVLEQNKLVLQLPGNEDAEFYDNGEGGSSRFQRMMDFISLRPGLKARLTEERKRLRLLLNVKNEGGPQSRLRGLQSILRELGEAAQVSVSSKTILERMEGR